MPRYFFSENAGRPIVAGGHRFVFEQMGVIAGAVQGLLRLDEPGASVLAARPGIVEIAAEAYEEAIARKRKNPKAYVTVDLAPPNPAVAAAQPAPAPKPMLPPVKPTNSGKPAVVADGATVPGHEPRDSLPESIDDAVDLGTAAPPAAEPPKPKPRKR